MKNDNQKKTIALTAKDYEKFIARNILLLRTYFSVYMDNNSERINIEHLKKTITATQCAANACVDLLELLENQNG